jgi:hypothetical protein
MNATKPQPRDIISHHSSIKHLPSPQTQNLQNLRTFELKVQAAKPAGVHSFGSDVHSKVFDVVIGSVSFVATPFPFPFAFDFDFDFSAGWMIIRLVSEWIQRSHLCHRFHCIMSRLTKLNLTKPNFASSASSLPWPLPLDSNYGILSLPRSIPSPP